MNAENVSAVIVTRGDVDISQIVESLPFSDIVVYDNSQRRDQGIYGRYAGIREAKNEVVYVQDDDVLVSCFDELLAAYRPGVLTVNYPEPWDIPWVARGAVFDRDLPHVAFWRYDSMFERDHWFTHYGCDGVFALLTDRVNVVDFGSEDLPHGFAAGRVSTSPGWYDDKRPLIQERCDQLKAAE